MNLTLTYALTSDGTSDRTLMPFLEQALQNIQGLSSVNLNGLCDADAEPYDGPSNRTLGARLKWVQERMPADIIFIHRDAEASGLAIRRQEVLDELAQWSGISGVPVIPVRMTEAWLLLDEAAIRRAACRPNGTENLNLPSLKKAEQLSDPKEALFAALRMASQAKGRKLDEFNRNIHAKRHDVARHFSRFDLVSKLESHAQFTQDCAVAVNQFLDNHKNH